MAQETVYRPKPMVEIGGYPILWHIMNTYAAFGVSDFIVCAGYKGDVIKDYFDRFYLYHSDVVFDLGKRQRTIGRGSPPGWRVTVVDTGRDSGTGGRLRYIRNYLNDADFFLTYGDGVANIDVAALVQCHRGAGRLATVTAVRPPARFGAIRADGDRVVRFDEKAGASEGWISGGFFVLNQRVLDYIPDDSTSFEIDCLTRLAEEGQLTAYFHHGFWHPMDTIRDQRHLDGLWASGQAPWLRQPGG